MPKRLLILTGLLFALFLSAVWFVPGRVAGADVTAPAVPPQLPDVHRERRPVPRRRPLPAARC